MVNQLICQLINQTNIWYFQIIGISWRLCFIYSFIRFFQVFYYLCTFIYLIFFLFKISVNHPADRMWIYLNKYTMQTMTLILNQCLFKFSNCVSYLVLLLHFCILSDAKKKQQQQKLHYTALMGTLMYQRPQSTLSQILWLKSLCTSVRENSHTLSVHSPQPHYGYEGTSLHHSSLLSQPSLHNANPLLSSLPCPLQPKEDLHMLYWKHVTFCKDNISSTNVSPAMSPVVLVFPLFAKTAQTI